LGFNSNTFGNLTDRFLTETDLIDQYVGNKRWSWGSGSTGTLGDGTNASKSSPVQTVGGATNWRETGYNFGIKTDGTLWMMGRNDAGQLGDGTNTYRSSPVQTIAGGNNWKQVVTAPSTAASSAGIKTDGTLWVWGANSYSTLGDGTATPRSSPVQISGGGANWKQVSGARQGGSLSPFFLAIKTDGSLWTWGANTYGQLGITGDNWASVPVQSTIAGTNWKYISAGYGFSIGIKNDGTLWGRGSNQDGALGLNITYGQNSPTLFFANSWASVATCELNAAAIKTDGSLWVWGNGGAGNLGDNNNRLIYRSSPIQTIAGGNNWKSVAVGQAFHVAIKNDLTLWTWGGGSFDGVLGDNTIVQRSSPVQTIAGGANWTDAECGVGHIIARKNTGQIWLWGYNYYGQLGDGTTVSKSSPVQTVASATNWKFVDAGYMNSAAIKEDGTLWTWGRNDIGELGDGTVLHKSSPVQTVAGGTDWKSVSSGRRFSAAIKTDGTLWTWGNNYRGQLGDGTIIDRSSPVQTIAGGTNWLKLGRFNRVAAAAAIKTDGTLWTWGLNSNGNLGDGTTVSKSSPVQTVAGGTDWVETSIGRFSGIGIKSDNTMWTWAESNRPVGGNWKNVSAYTQEVTSSYWKKVACARKTTLAIKLDGSLWAWGDNGYGQLGTNDTVNRSSPVQTIAGGNNWKEIAVTSVSCAIKTDGTLWTWGLGDSGELGDGVRTRKSSPVQTIAGGNNWKQVSCGYNIVSAVTYGD
jgi:alpha-tubulin suppressor-like RCC1 family protein